MRKGTLFLEQFLGSDREAMLESVICVDFVVCKSQAQITQFYETMRDRLKVRRYLRMLDFPLHFFWVQFSLPFELLSPDKTGASVTCLMLREVNSKKREEHVCFALCLSFL